MPVFTLRFSDDGQGLVKSVEFTSVDAGGALRAARGEAAGRNVELWLGKKKLCSMHRSEEVWCISS
ncbi:hypothetical protein HT136_19645 [Novosphingobium profundi]|uniref:hypothetical protein n=1 Tax=Novosphingobium profundi TaxID=1774954 RepID=UPI001BDACA95|nr:hypothetical protein [Novosphingobium profundi]MBT0670586.1 hypothetical protein [Novosphingobium profundi]